MEYFTKEELKIINSRYGTAIRLREIALNMFNCNTYPRVDLAGLILNSDKKHLELFYKILNMNIEYINSSKIIKDLEIK